MMSRVDVPPKVAIVILNWEGLADTRECLASLTALRYPNFHVIVVDNGSSADDGECLEREYGSWIEVLRLPENLYYAAGNNAGIRFALSHWNPAYLLLMNNDTIAHPDLLTELVRVAESRPQTGIVSPIVLLYGRPRQIQHAGESIRWFRHRSKSLYKEFQSPGWEDWPSDTASGACMLIAGRLLEAAGLLDDALFPFLLTDVAYSLRTKKAGFDVRVARKARVWHKTSVSVARVPFRKVRHQVRENLFLRREFMNAWGLLLYLILFPLLYGPLAIGSQLLRVRDRRVLAAFAEGLRSFLRDLIRPSLPPRVDPGATRAKP